MQIGSKLGCDSAKEIATVPGGTSPSHLLYFPTSRDKPIVSGIMMALGDLQFDIGLPFASDGLEPVDNKPIESVVSAAKSDGVFVMGYCRDSEVLKKRIEQGLNGASR